MKTSRSANPPHACPGHDNKGFCQIWSKVKSFLKKRLFSKIHGKEIIIFVDKIIYFLFNYLTIISYPSTIFQSYPGEIGSTELLWAPYGGIFDRQSSQGTQSLLFFSLISMGSNEGREFPREVIILSWQKNLLND